MEHSQAAKTAQVVALHMAAVDLSQRQVAALTGIPLVTLNRTLNGHRAFKMDELAAVAQLLGMKSSELLAAAEALVA